MFIPLLGFTDTDCTGRTDIVFFFLEKPQFVSVKGTTKKADAFGLFVYPNWVPAVVPHGGGQTKHKSTINHTVTRSQVPLLTRRMNCLFITARG